MSLTVNWMIRKAGQEEGEKGEQLEKLGLVMPSETSAKVLRYVVRDNRDNQNYEVVIQNDLTCRCSCESYYKAASCRHIISSLIRAEKEEALKPLSVSHARSAGQDLLSMISGSIPSEGNMKLEVSVRLDPDREMPLRVGLRTGQEKLYVIKNIPRFIESLESGSPIQFGKGFEYLPAWMRYSEAQKRILYPIRAYCAANGEAALNQEDARMMPLPSVFAEELLDCLKEYPFFMMQEKQKRKLASGVTKVRIPLLFSVTGTLHGLRMTILSPKSMIPVTSSFRYVLINEKIIETDTDQRAVLKFVWENQTECGCTTDFELDDTGRVIGELVPYLKRVGVVDFSPELEKKLIREKLRSSVYLDADGRDIVARTEFIYGETRIDPFQQAKKVTLDRGEKLLLRDAEQEQKVLDLLGVYGFRVRSDRVYLTGTDQIWNFLSDGVRKLQDLSEIYLSKAFEKLKPRRPGISGRMTMKNGQIVLDLRLDDQPTEETFALMEALSKHRGYFRMKDGSFLELNGLEEWYDLAYAISEGGIGKQNEDGEVLISPAKASYMSALIQEAGLPVEKSNEIISVFEEDEDLYPVPMLGGGYRLRPYQQHGYCWLRKLDRLHMGGILADAMGTGKTVQIIALLLSVKEEKRPSLVVSPTSLTWNWQAEIRRFAPDLSTVVLSGTIAQRENVIRHVAMHGDVDVMITSYPLMRRDIDLLKQIRFRYAILDEAQQIKNAASIGAGSARSLQADTKFALTGTPMENGVGELWSLFDFIMPGYLPGYSTFLNRYQDGRNHEDLLKRIKPFMLRRLKENVLSEIPEKQVTVLTAHMSPEQEKVYSAALMRLKPRIVSLMEEKGLNRGRIEVLAAMTELRQICCHPALVLENYHGSSGKMEMLLDILPGAVSAGHRILLFSQFTSMLKILRPRLEEEGYRTMYLDGDTPSRGRLELTEQFNAGGADIFLISLKAGGSGLNLTGADMVIQYDPWWNPAAEEQAADRAHRIGQKHKVEVIRLVTSESIEEQVVELGERKRALFDMLITPGETSLNLLTEQDIAALFS